MPSIITKSAKNAVFGAKTGQKSKIARIFVLLVFAITLYWHIEKNNTGLVSGQLKKTDASKLGRCGFILGSLSNDGHYLHARTPYWAIGD